MPNAIKNDPDFSGMDQSTDLKKEMILENIFRFTPMMDVQIEVSSLQNYPEVDPGFSVWEGYAGL